MSASEVATVVDRPDRFIAERCGGAGGTAASGTAEAERDEAAVDTASTLGLRFPEAREPVAGVEMDKAGNLGTDSAASAATASSDSFSPTQVRANHRPPATPRTSRCARRQWRGLVFVRSRATTGA